ncbi:Pentatricopeptide repeat-containing protein [Melia azedarach]|uniref:Pentatricopeptide repeat-containing protein n=1 Tax=Melia azedarach TaxID=155640 RepID=A0ACC1Z3R8_MELAZ|nr:Pentatricopeptide repeat-containing protein [Melia azedarach]
MATTITRSSAVLFTVIFFLNLHFLYSTSEPVISASPAVLPSVTAPNMSSFFPSPTTTASPNSEAFPPVPSSGEFIGKSSSGSATFDGGPVIFGVRICILFVITSALFFI